jgi:hypothetical protein
MDFLYARKKNDTLDPLSVIIKLYIYSYKDPDAKLAIGNNKLLIQDSGIFQGAVRLIKHDNKNDIPILTMPILYACNTYINDNEYNYRLLFTKVLNSLDKLKLTYKGNEITYNIDTLEEYINSFLNKNINNSVVNVDNLYNTDGAKIKQYMYKSIATIWSKDRLIIVFNIILEIESNSNKDLKEKLLTSLLTYMDYIDTLAQNKILGLV